MKKITILTSLLALTACGGGGGGGGVSAVVKPDSVDVTKEDFARDVDTGLGITDINKIRSAQYVKALATVKEIESEYGSAEISAAPARHSSTARSSGTIDLSLIAQDTITDAYQKMYDILYSGNTEGVKNFDVLMSLALSGQSKANIYSLFGSFQNLAEGINNFITLLLSGTDERINHIKDEAQGIYKDFGQEFKVSLDNARFSTTSSANYFTFVFQDGKVKSLKVQEQGGQDYNYASVGGGKFETHIKGMNYELTGFKLHEADEHEVSVEIVYPDGHVPDVETIKADLLAAAKANYNLSDDAVEIDTINAALNNSFVHGDIEWDGCDNAAGCVVYSHVDYTDSITIDSKGRDLGLMYSDFGLKLDYATFHNTEGLPAGLVYQEHTVFAGGYEDKVANAPELANEQVMEFQGTAFAGVTSKSNDWADDFSDYVQPDINYYDGSAKLIVTGTNNINNPTQKLVADFDNWYTVTVDNIGHAGGPKGGDGAIKFIAKDGQVIDEMFAVSTGEDGKLVGDLDHNYVKYYGPDAATPTEAVGCVQYVEREAGTLDETDWTFKADISFGAKKQ